MLLESLRIVGIILFILFFFGFCIFIHEFGHLLAGLWTGMHVDKFSIGFGPKLFGFTRKSIEFAVSLLPLGGYVSLPQIDIAEPEKASEPSNDKNDKNDNTDKTPACPPLPPASPFARGVTAFAGPFFNFLFGFFLAAIMWIAGLWVPPSASSCLVTDVPRVLPNYTKVGLLRTDQILQVNHGAPKQISHEEFWEEVETAEKVIPLKVQRKGSVELLQYQPKKNPEWEAGLRPGDRIIAVNGKSFKEGVNEMLTHCIYNNGEELTLSLIRDGKPLSISYTPVPNPDRENLGVPFFQARNPMILGEILPGSPAEHAGLRKGDQLLQFNRQNLYSQKQFRELLQNSDSRDFTLLIVRDDLEKTISVPSGFQGDLKAFGAHFPIYITGVAPDSPASRMGLQEGDEIRKSDGTDFSEISELQEMIAQSQGAPLSFQILRQGKVLNFPNAIPQRMRIGTEEKYLLGITLSDAPQKIIGHPSPWKQFSKVCTQTFQTLGRLFAPVTARITGRHAPQASIRVQHMSGPAGILTLFWLTLRNQGFRGGLGLVILITFSLGLFNLLPLPLLDGGHILFAILETIFRRRIPPKVVTWLQNIFACLLIALFLYITFFDGKRIVKMATDKDETPQEFQPVPAEQAPAETNPLPLQPAPEQKENPIP